MDSIIFTIGHSTHSIEYLLELLNLHRITAVGDVRSSPYSRVNPQFNRETLKQALSGARIAYVFLGRELGARSDDPECYDGNKVSYERLAETPEFKSGLERVHDGSLKFRLALLCAEKEPLDCHRTILVSRQLQGMGVQVQHILADGSVESHEDAMARLLRQLGLPQTDMFRSAKDIEEEAYQRQGTRIAYQLPTKESEHGAETGREQ